MDPMAMAMMSARPMETARAGDWSTESIPEWIEGWGTTRRWGVLVGAPLMVGGGFYILVAVARCIHISCKYSDYIKEPRGRVCLTIGMQCLPTPANWREPRRGADFSSRQPFVQPGGWTLPSPPESVRKALTVAPH